MSRDQMTPEQVDAYDKVFDQLPKTFGPRVVELLHRVRDICREAGMTADDEPIFIDGDDFRWSIGVWRAPARVLELRGEIEDARQLGRDPQRQLCELASLAEERVEDQGIDISITIAEAQSYGDDDEPFGVNFALDVVEFGGRILGGLTPYNYSPKVWVDARDADAVEARWAILERADLSAIPELIGEQ